MSLEGKLTASSRPPRACTYRLPARRSRPYPSPAVVPAVLSVIGVLIVGMWWRDTTASSVHGVGQAMIATGSLLGLLGGYLVLVQLVLMARLGWFERAVGFDRLTAWHRALGTNVIVILVLHALLVTVGYADTNHASIFSEPFSLVRTFRFVVEAMVALTIFVGVALSSIRASRRRLGYEAWYWIHVGVYVAVALAVLHQVGSGVDFVGHPLNQALWVLLYVVAGLCILVTRVGNMVRTHLRHRLVVHAVVPESSGAVSIWMRGRDVDLMGAEPGQFFLWRFLSRGHMLSAHPYSISAVPGRRHLRITVKAEGDHSAKVRDLHPGDRVLADGPFGHFTARHRTRAGCLLVAGGSGIAPIRALAEDLASMPRTGPADTVVLYRASRFEDLLFRRELDGMAADRLLTVHYLLGRRHELGHDPLSEANIRRIVPDVHRREIWVCGPTEMCTSVAANLHHLGVPPRRVHTERFSLW
jgi:predicted ferric reductase